ncbi:cysteine-rich CWC family protein [Shewanella algidipiscicola]|uniref:cysteine-rich CWC family protein n=1 Tax=Shewanella algidipiscicola TaxID=614070 RepID=UPI000E74983A|nr:cysteine-rich CWC family protein [Shewanella algidipiscicola]
MIYKQADSPTQSDGLSDATIQCPLCQQSNECAVANQRPSETCWCHSQVFVPKASLTVNVRRDACLCQACAAALMAEQQAGLKRID